MAKPNILVLGNEEAKSAVSAAGFHICDPYDKKSDYSAIIIDLTSSHSNFANEIIAQIGKSSPTRILTFAWIDENQSIENFKDAIKMGFDGVFSASTPIDYIKARLLSANRIRTMANEAKLRFKTLETLEPRRFELDTKSDKPIRVLIYGQPCPFVLYLTSILDSLNILSVCAISSFTAFDFLHRGNFDAIIAIGQDDRNGITSFCSGLRRNSRLFHLPCLVFANENFDNLEELINRGATDVAYIGLEDELAIARLMTLIDEKRRREQLAISFAMTRTAKVADSATGLYSEKYFITHVNSLYRNGFSSNSFFALGFLKIIPHNNGLLNLSDNDKQKVFNQCGSMISRLIRTEDSACRFDEEIFAIIFPSANNQEAAIALNRICAVLETSAFSVSDNASCMVLTKKWHISISENDDIAKSLETARTFMNAGNPTN